MVLGPFGVGFRGQQFLVFWVHCRVKDVVSQCVSVWEGSKGTRKASYTDESRCFAGILNPKPYTLNPTLGGKNMCKKLCCGLGSKPSRTLPRSGKHFGICHLRVQGLGFKICNTRPADVCTRGPPLVCTNKSSGQHPTL